MNGDHIIIIIDVYYSISIFMHLAQILGIQVTNFRN